MKIAAMIVRILMGLLFLFASVSYFYFVFTNKMPAGEMSLKMRLFNEGLRAAAYLMPSVKVIELLCGVAFVTGRFVPLASILITPIIYNIFFSHLLMGPNGLPSAIFLVLANAFLIFYNREAYKPLFRSK